MVDEVFCNIYVVVLGCELKWGKTAIFTNLDDHGAKAELFDKELDDDGAAGTGGHVEASHTAAEAGAGGMGAPQAGDAVVNAGPV